MDEKLAVQQCVQGNPEAFAGLVNQYQFRVLALAMNITRDKEEARDVAQDVFIQAYTNLHRFDIQKSFKNWIMGITVKRSIDQTRKQKTFLKFFNRYLTVARLYNQPENKKIEESVIFHPLLRYLNKKERAALSLQLNEEYTAKEIGEILDCSENTVRVYLFKARQKIKKRLGDHKTVSAKYEVTG